MKHLNYLIISFCVLTIACNNISTTTKTDAVNNAMTDTAYRISLYHSNIMPESLYYTCQPSPYRQPIDSLMLKSAFNNLDSIIAKLHDSNVINDSIISYLRDYGFIRNIKYNPKNDSIIIYIADFYEDRQIFATIRTSQDTLIANSLRKKSIKIPEFKDYDRISAISRCDTLCQGFIYDKYRWSVEPKSNLYVIRIHYYNGKSNIKVDKHNGNTYLYVYSKKYSNEEIIID